MKNIIVITTSLLFSGLVFAKPDLAVTKLEMEPDCKTFHVTYENKGDALPSSYYDIRQNTFGVSFRTENHYARTFLNNGPLSTVDYGRELAQPGGKVVRTYNFEVEGIVEMSVSIDPQLSYDERTRSNNNKHQKFTCASNPNPPGFPGVRYMSVRVTPTCDIRVLMRNDGPDYLSRMAYDDSFGVNVYRANLSLVADNMAWSNLYLSEFDPNQRLKYPRGRAVALFKNDDMNLQWENGKKIKFTLSNTGNNPRGNPWRESTEKFLKCTMDLAVIRIESQNDIRVGREATFRVLVQNTAEKVSPATHLAIKIGGETRAKYFPVPELRPGQKFYVTRRETFGLAGNVLIKSMVDPRRRYTEYDETNNLITKTIQVRN